MAPPIYVKGGAWANVEDQILKAAVSKYGLTQWARVASLLPKKTAKQAKARWNEYLNPTIRSEWTREDDVKLLDLAKLLPNQWRSVGQIMGRTATQCVERYQKLLDAVTKDVSDEAEKENVDFTGPGIETLPALGNAYESLPSRPDAEDMEEDEKEMLLEAKARLANTQGKKAKRKDRERLLQESRRLALLQKRRELKAAGINVSLTLKNKAKRKEFDYNADIPHERVPLPGKFDALAEERQNVDLQLAFQKQVSAKGTEYKKRKEPRASIKAAAAAVTSLDEQQSKRRKLDLPAPGASDHAREMDSQILQRSRELAADGSEIAASFKGAEEAHFPISRPSRKKVVSQFKKLILLLPVPHTERKVPAPNAETFTPVNPQAELLRLVDEQSQSRVVQKGLPIPSLDVFSKENLDPIESEIYDEAQLLARSDQSSIPVVLIENDFIEKIEQLVEVELKFTPQKLPVYTLPELEQALDTIYELLGELNESANNLESGINHRLEENAEAFSRMCREIDYNSEQLRICTSEYRKYSRILQDEEVSIQTRSATLSDLVERVRMAENRVKAHVT